MPHQPYTLESAYQGIKDHFTLDPRFGVDLKERQCRYRVDLHDGKPPAKCGIGSIIPDDVYAPEMECQSVGNLTHDYPALDSLFGTIRLMDFLDEVQMAHDSSALNGVDTIEAFLNKLDMLFIKYQGKSEVA